jgi:hypothetical protein
LKALKLFDLAGLGTAAYLRDSLGRIVLDRSLCGGSRVGSPGVVWIG